VNASIIPDGKETELADRNASWEEVVDGPAVSCARVRQCQGALDSHCAYAWSSPVWVDRAGR